MVACSSGQCKTHDPCKCLETFSNELRMEIIKQLGEGPKNVTELTAATGMERSRVSHALMELKKCNVVLAKKDGRQMRYSLREHTPVNGTTGTLFQIIEKHVHNNCSACHKLR